MSNTTLAFLLTSIAGLSTLVGTIIILFKSKNYQKLICSALSFAAAVMICISITDLVPESISMLSLSYSPILTCILCFIFIIIGIILSMLIDHYFPSDYDKTNNKALYKVGIISMLAIIFHNIPEDCSCYVS